jgi:hypothetical protein
MTKMFQNVPKNSVAQFVTIIRHEKVNMTDIYQPINIKIAKIQHLSTIFNKKVPTTFANAANHIRSELDYTNIKSTA